MTTPTASYVPSKFARRGQETYNRVVKSNLNPDNVNKFVAIEIETLPKQGQLALFEKLSALAEADIPVSLLQSMAEAERSELIDLDDALQELEESETL